MVSRNRLPVGRDLELALHAFLQSEEFRLVIEADFKLPEHSISLKRFLLSKQLLPQKHENSPEPSGGISQSAVGIRLRNH
jgi:hypothetical protein